VAAPFSETNDQCNSPAEALPRVGRGSEKPDGGGLLGQGSCAHDARSATRRNRYRAGRLVETAPEPPPVREGVGARPSQPAKAAPVVGSDGCQPAGLKTGVAERAANGSRPGGAAGQVKFSRGVCEENQPLAYLPEARSRPEDARVADARRGANRTFARKCKVIRNELNDTDLEASGADRSRNRPGGVR